MWIGRDAVHLGRLFAFLSEESSLDAPLILSCPIGVLISPESGDMSLRATSFWRRLESPEMLLNAEKSRDGACAVGEFLHGKVGNVDVVGEPADGKFHGVLFLVGARF